MSAAAVPPCGPSVFLPQGLPVSTPGWHNCVVGMVHAEVEVGRDRGPRAMVRFLVDSGAAYSVLPWETWRKLGLKPKLRLGTGGAEYVSDNGNLILDCGVCEIRNPARLERDLLAIPGVVGTGLFVGIADLVLVAMRDGTIKTLHHPH